MATQTESSEIPILHDPGKVLQRRTHSANRFGRVTERIQGNQTLARARERASACDKVAEGGVREREANLMRMRGNLVGVSDKGASRRVGQAAVQPGLTRVERASKIGAEIEDYKIVDRGAAGL